jgi:hypothetical protein
VWLSSRKIEMSPCPVKISAHFHKMFADSPHFDAAPFFGRKMMLLRLQSFDWLNIVCLGTFFAQV